MKNKLTVKQYAAKLGLKSTAAIYNRIGRGTLKSTFDGITWVYPKSDKTKSVGRPKKYSS